MATSPRSQTLESGQRAAAGTDKRAEAFSYLAAGLLCCAALIWVMQLWHADMRVPFFYGVQTDLSFENMLIKDNAENGWYLHNPRLGAPGVQDLRDFPIPASVHYLSMKAIGWFTSSWGEVENIYYLAGFLLATWSALAVQRHFGIGRGPAVVTALLFAFAPFHFYRGENHLRLSTYYVIPLTGLVLLWVMWDEALFVTMRRGRFLVLPRPTRKGLTAIAVCVILAGLDVYYACLTGLLLVVAGIYRAFEQRTFRRLGPATILAAIILLAVIVNLLPSIVHILAEGKNPEVAVRGPIEAEIYSLKLTQLVLPVTGHRIPWLAGFKAAYNGTPLQTPISEGDGSALGACFAAGFCFLLLTLFAGYPCSGRPRHRELIHSLARLNLGAFLLGTMGGVGAMLALTISPQIRAYARVGIFISFFSAMAVAAVLDEIRRRWVRPGLYGWIFRGALACLFVAGILDQTTSADVPPYPYARAQYSNDADFSARAEGLLPHGTMVLQLPYVRFPDYPPPRGIAPYDPLRPYLHSVSLRWSFGAMKGRYWDSWQGDLLTRPIEDVLEAAAVAGFGAVCIDRNGYADRAASIETWLRGMGLPSIESRDGRLSLYDIGPYAARLRAAYGPEEWARARETVLHPLVLDWLPQCSSLEGNAGHNWRWCGSRDGLMVENPSGHARKIEIHGALAAAAGGACSVGVGGPGWTETLRVSNTALAPLRESLDVAPGTSIFRFKSDCRRLLTAADPRPLVFRVEDFGAALPDAPPAPEFAWKGGFYGLETGGGQTWHWCTDAGELVIRNPGPTSEVSVRMRLAAAPGVTAPLSIAGPGFAESVPIGLAGTVFSKRLTVPPGDTAIRFSSRATPVVVGKDPRKFVFRVEDLRLGNPLLAPRVISVN